MPLTECMERTTNRQYEAWSRWLAEDYNTPEREDYYAMLIAAEVRRLGVLVVKALLGKDLGEVEMKDFLLKFCSRQTPEGKGEKERTDRSDGDSTRRDGEGHGDPTDRFTKRQGTRRHPPAHSQPTTQPTSPSPFLQEDVAGRSEVQREGLLKILGDKPGIIVTPPCIPENPFNPIPERYRKLQKHYKPPEE